MNISPDHPEDTTPAFAQRVIVERLRLAVTDPEGEADAVRPVNPTVARARLLEMQFVPRPRLPDRPPLDPEPLLRAIGADPNRQSGRVPCPAHGGEDRNLAWRLVNGNKVLLTCWSHGCSFEQIVEAIR